MHQHNVFIMLPAPLQQGTLSFANFQIYICTHLIRMISNYITYQFPIRHKHIINTTVKILKLISTTINFEKRNFYGYVLYSVKTILLCSIGILYLLYRLKINRSNQFLNRDIFSIIVIFQFIVFQKSTVLSVKKKVNFPLLEMSQTMYYFKKKVFK